MALPPAGDPVATPAQAPDAEAGGQAAARGFLRQALIFTLIGLGLYLCLYGASEMLVYKHALRNRFFAVHTAPLRSYDDVILGASHAAVFDYEDMTSQLEGLTGRKILNLSEVGAGPAINRLMLDYFLAGHDTAHVLYVADSFAFYSADWNEKRLEDARLFYRAPFSFRLVWELATHGAPLPVILSYATGFTKINNPGRCAPDITDEEATRFTKTYKPVAQIDKQRLAYMYPGDIDQAAFADYLGQFEEMIAMLEARSIAVTVIKPPIPQRIYDALPGEAEFDAALRAVLDRHNVPFHDFSLVNNDDALFYNTDHLNRDGVLSFFNGYLADLLRVAKGRPAGTTS
jgi:hypothetical protein